MTVAETPPSTIVGAASGVAEVKTVAAVAIWLNEIVSPAPLLNAPVLVLVRDTAPLLPMTLAVTTPAPKSPDAAEAATGVPSPTLPAGTVKSIRLTAALVPRFVPVPTCKNRTLGTATRKSSLALAVRGVPAPVVTADSACETSGTATPSTAAQARTM